MKKTAINNIGIDNCTGCYACYNICPYEAIEMKLTEDGFYKPHIIEEKCVECGVCALKCPVLSTDYNNDENPDFFIAYSNNKEIRKKSSSGGIFSEIAGKVLENNGDVYGVVWDDKLELKHIKIDTEEGLANLRGSKYLQSKVGKTYKEIKSSLQNKEKTVLFIGTPCQVAGIKKLVDNERLLTCDLLCHGVPSYIPFKSYINQMDEKINKVDFRNKITGWTHYSISFIGENKIKTKLFTKDKFFMGFLKDYYLNEACYNCKFSKLPRQGDITLGDFWGIDKAYDKNDEGVSVVIVNNEKGSEMIKSLKLNSRIYLEKVSKHIATKSNLGIYCGELQRPKKRDNIIDDIKIHGFEKIAKSEIHIVSSAEVILKRCISIPKKLLKKLMEKVK